MEEKKSGARSSLITLDRFNFGETEETFPKNENWQLDEYCLLQNYRAQSQSTSAEGSEDKEVLAVAEKKQIAAGRKPVEKEKEPIKMPELCQMLVNAHAELTSLMDLSLFLLMTRECQSKLVEPTRSQVQPPKTQLMKKVIVRMVNNSLQLNFHPKLAALAKTKPLDVAITLKVVTKNEVREQRFTVGYDKPAQNDEASRLVQMIDHHLRYLMLQQTFDKIVAESASSPDLTIDKQAYSARLRLNVGSIVAIDITLQFFANQEASCTSGEFIRPKVFREVLQSMMENTYSPQIMSNLGFLFANRLLSSELNSLISGNREKDALRNASCARSRLRWDKRVDPFKSLTFTLMKETDLFFASIKNQRWQQGNLDPNEVVKNRYLQSQSVFVPRASVQVVRDPETGLYELHFTEDVINRQQLQGVDNAANSHTIHGQGCWDIDKTYWINFHQNKKVVTELSQIAKIVDFIQ